MTDPINPSYYAAGDWQSIEVIEAFVPDKPHRWAALKYIFRAGKKNPKTEAQDLRKAVWWLEREISHLDKAPAPEETGCADDCVHPSHRHVPRYDEQNEPTNGVDALGRDKPPCHCPEGFCMTDKSSPPKYVYCRKAEGVAREPVCVMWSEPTPKNPCHCGVDCYTKSTGMALPAGTVCRKADQ